MSRTRIKVHGVFSSSRCQSISSLAVSQVNIRTESVSSSTFAAISSRSRTFPIIRSDPWLEPIAFVAFNNTTANHSPHLCRIVSKILITFIPHSLQIAASLPFHMYTNPNIGVFLCTYVSQCAHFAPGSPLNFFFRPMFIAR